VRVGAPEKLTRKNKAGLLQAGDRDMVAFVGREK
jgi:hypothetical protein